MADLTHHTSEPEPALIREILKATGALPDDMSLRQTEYVDNVIDVLWEFAWRAGWNECARDAERNAGVALPLGLARDRVKPGVLK